MNERAVRNEGREKEGRSGACMLGKREIVVSQVLRSKLVITWNADPNIALTVMRRCLAFAMPIPVPNDS